MFGTNQTTHDGIETESPREVLAVFLAAREAGADALADQVTAEGVERGFNPVDGDKLDIVELYDMEDVEADPEHIRDSVMFVNRPPEAEREDATLVGGRINQGHGDSETTIAGWVKDGQLI